MSERRYHGRRALLNLPGLHSTAAIVAEVEDTSTWRAGRDRDGDPINTSYQCTPKSMLQIANCDRSILFQVDVDDSGEMPNNLHKLDTLIDALVQLRAGLVVEQERYEARKAALAEKRRKRKNKRARERRAAAAG